MPKAYWIAHVTITNPERYKDYITLNAAAFKKYNARFIVRGGQHEIRGGFAPDQRHVVLEFADYETAKACYDSHEYKAAAAVRDEASKADIMIIEGYDGPQPGQS